MQLVNWSYWDTLGRELKKIELNNERSPITFTNIGIYLVHLVEQGQITRWQRLVVN